MSLQAAYDDLAVRLDEAEHHITSFVVNKAGITTGTDFSYGDECWLEGVLSKIWQCWGNFCRECVFQSCLGTITSSGVAVPALASATSDQLVSGAAVRAKKLTAIAPYWGPANSILRNEPTWGDVDVLTRIISRLGPSNAGQMLAAFSSGHSSARSLQRLRNCAAHHNNETMADITLMAPYFVAYPISHAVQAMFWLEPSTNDYLVTASIEGLRDAAEAAIS
jgi:hypothetical protein